MRIDPANYIWWLVSRAAGIVALGLISLAVLIGLTMATKIVQRPGLGRKLARLHEHLALVALGAIAVHGATLLGDRWLHAGVRSLIVPFTLGYRPLYTGLGMIGAYLAALLGLSFYARRRIGTRLWRRLHRATVIVWVLGVAHTLGAGTDAGTLWLRITMLATGAPIVFLTLVRILQRGHPAAGRAARGHLPEPRQAPSAPRRAQREEHAPPARPRPVIAKEAA